MGARRGRLPDAEREARRTEILDAALETLVGHRYEDVTMLDVARRAGASKETLYRWFGDRDGLFAELIERNAAAVTSTVQDALSADAEPRTSLTTFASRLLRLLTGPKSVALNRAAMGSPDLAHVLLDSGRHTVGPLVGRYLLSLRERGIVTFDDSEQAFSVLYGLIVRDTQIRVLLGESPPDPGTIDATAAAAVDHFLALHPTVPGSP